MKTKIFLFFIAVLFFETSQAQKDSLVSLDVVILNDVKLKQFSAGQKVTYLEESAVKREQSFTDVLNFNSLLYFKENGYGMLSSPSFRGTTASQTVVIWNGININSQLTGQTNFNNLATNSFSSIAVKSGGGAVQYGSGAVGGSIHLGNDFHFKKKQKHDLGFSYGSFSTLNTAYNGVFSNENSALNVGFQHKSSDNDYDYLGTNQKNENGSYTFSAFNLNGGHFLGENTLLKLFHNSEFNDRNLSGSLTYVSKDSYKDENAKTMLQLDLLNSKITSSIRMAHLYELYQYYPDGKNQGFYTTGKTNSFIGKYDASIKIRPKRLLIKGILEYKRIEGIGSNISEQQQNIISAILLINQKFKDNFEYGVHLRAEYNDDFNVPFIFSVDGKWHLHKTTALKFSLSKNYRTPTFNDLYWRPGGNPELNPEKSYQGEMGIDIHLKSHQFNLTSFYIHSKDLIKWIPMSTGIWSPVNIASTENYGLEFSYKSFLKYGNHQWVPEMNYGYTCSTDLDLNKQLIYVPRHKATASLAYVVRNWRMQYQFMLNGQVYTTTDNSQSIEGYNLSNFKVSYRWKLWEQVETNVQFSVNNIFNESYQNVAFRPMPNRNYNLNINLNI